MRSRLLGLGFATALLAACAGIPSSGPVRVGEQVRAKGTDPFTRVLPPPPAPGATPLEIVTGFLTANASPDNDYAVARSYLTAGAARDWNPDSGALVYPSSVTQAIADPGKVTITVAPTGTIGPHGEFAPVTSKQPQAILFKLSKVGSDWRISAPQKGLLLTDLDVERSLRYYNVYFPDPARTSLVPSPVLLPAGAGTATALVQALLAGPPSWLAPAVRSALPSRTELVGGRAPVVDGVVQIDLSSRAASLTAEESAALSAQLVWTLRQLPDVNGLQISAQGLPLRAGGPGSVQSVEAWPQFDPDGLSSIAAGYFSRAGRVFSILPRSLIPIVGPAGDGKVPLSWPAIALPGTAIAGLDAVERTLLAGPIGAGDKIGELFTGDSLTAPSWDRQGAVWTVDRRSGGAPAQIWSVVPGSPRVAVSADESLPKGKILALRVARDGVRVAVVVRAEDRTTIVYTAVIVRSQGSIELRSFRDVLTPLTEISDAVWASADRLLVLGRSSPDLIQPALVDLTQPGPQLLGPVAGAADGSIVVSLAAGPGHASLIGTSDGKVWSYSGSGWDPLGDGRYPAYPG